MLVEEAQGEVRRIYRAGFVGQAVSGLLWWLSAAFATWRSPVSGMWILVVGGAAIYPATSLCLRLLGQRASLSAGNPFRHLAIQAAFVLPVSMPLVAPVTAYRLEWFYPSMMVLLGAHYLPFATLYGMRSFLALAGTLIAAGLGIALYVHGSGFSLGGWVAGAILWVFAAVEWIESRREA